MTEHLGFDMTVDNSIRKKKEIRKKETMYGCPLQASIHY